METYNFIRFNVPSSKKSSSIENCRLKSGLNEHCLLKVFDYLNLDDLLQVSKLDPHFKELILKWTIKKKTFFSKFNKLKDSSYSLETHKSIQMLDIFGKSMRKIKMSGNHFSLWLETIMKHCEPATLTDVELSIFDYFRMNKDNLKVMYRCTPFFTNLQKFTFSQYVRQRYQEMCTEFLTFISTTATNLQELELQMNSFDLRFLKNMKNLRVLRLYLFRNSSYTITDLANCLGSNSRLQVFKFSGVDNITSISDALSKYSPDLTKFSDVNFGNPYHRLDEALIDRYNFLSTFQHLNCVTLTSYTFCGCDIYYPLMTLATSNINTLKVYINNVQPIELTEEDQYQIMTRSLPKFVHLQTVEFIFADYDGSGSSKWKDCDIRCQFMFGFMSQLQNLQYVRFRGNCVNWHKILRFTPSIRTLHIPSATLEEIENIGKMLRRMRQPRVGKCERQLLNVVLQKFYANYYKIEDLDEWKDYMNISYKT